MLFFSYNWKLKYGSLNVGRMGARSKQMCKNSQVAKNDALIIQKT